MSKPFLISDDVKQLRQQYPVAEHIKESYAKASKNERKGIIRLWITEGIPYAFKDNPLLYEEVRSFIASELKINPKEITLVGSGRTGYSLKPKVWGNTFSEKSDLDFTIISNEFYSKLVADYQKWVGDIESKKILPENPYQLKKWLECIITVNSNIPKGYIYTKNLHPHSFYPTVLKSYCTIDNLRRKLLHTHNCPKIYDLSIRIYSSWDNCIKQLHINLNSALNLWDNKR